ncbi:hypothetical protein [Pedobacter sp. V48]|jgi:hypothetical protein|uniref:hypothetical protein n=1 Tax=Pedobacter sp. V48 TaxID=509635 RepID=UPI0003E4DC98|nr:hypothetical protein [Pedobacter sp. V48]ETZ24666.1 hypothetical protein N824_00150 [Pedobacter sp. V48]
MDPFNIIITSHGEKVDLNIHPQEAGSYKVVCHGGLVGEIFMGKSGSWEAVSADDLDFGGYPIYEYDETSGHADLLLDEQVVQDIGQQISDIEGLS